MHFQDARHLARMSREEVSHYLNLHLRTINRYEKSGIAPKSVIECLKMISGQFPMFHKKQKDFAGWHFGKNYLWSDNGYKFTAGDIIAGKFALIEMDMQYRKLIRQQQKQKEYKARIDNIIQFPKIKRQY